MSIQQGGYQHRVIYQADRNMVHHLSSMRSHLHQVCGQYTNRIVRVETMDGQVVTGRLVSCDRGLMHLAVPHHHGQRAFFGSPSFGYDETILTLVLYELLVITLLST